jgi:hypothetical protein
MPVFDRAAGVYNLTLAPRDPTPLMRGWNRLEGRPRTADLERSLRAEVRDPLWFITRQWQLGEIEGEDAGSPIDARIAYETAALDTYTVGETSRPYDATTPLEVRVEREAAPFDLSLHMQASRIFERLLIAQGAARGSATTLDFSLWILIPASPVNRPLRPADSSRWGENFYSIRRSYSVPSGTDRMPRASAGFPA